MSGSIKPLLLLLVSLSQQSCIRELRITQLVYHDDGHMPSNVDVSRVPSSWVKYNQTLEFDREVHIESGHRIKILVLPDEETNK